MIYDFFIELSRNNIEDEEEGPIIENINDIEVDIDIDIEEYLDIKKILEIKRYILNEYKTNNKYNTLYYGFKNIIPTSKLLNNIVDKSYSTLWLNISYMGNNIFDILEMTKITEDFINYKTEFNN